MDDQALLGTFRDGNGVLTYSTGVPVDPTLSGSQPNQQPQLSQQQLLAPQQNQQTIQQPDGSYQPAFINLGPPYTDSATPFTGTPMAPEIWTGPGPAVSETAARLAREAGVPVGSLDDSGNIITSSAPPPGALDYSGGNSGLPANWQSFETDHNTGTGAGYFTMDGFYGGQGRPVPTQFQSGSSLPSTNNWRLLPLGYRSPEYIMRNGMIINIKSPDVNGPTMYNADWHSGAISGYPSAYGVAQGATQAEGWAGQVNGFANVGPFNPG